VQRNLPVTVLSSTEKYEAQKENGLLSNKWISRGIGHGCQHKPLKFKQQEANGSGQEA